MSNPIEYPSSPEHHTWPALGILLVHGIGSQRRSSTLLPGSDALTNWLRDRYGAEYVVVTRAKLDEGRATATLRLGSGDDAGWNLLVAESHWAESFTSPPLGVVVPWTLRATILVAMEGVRDLIEEAGELRRSTSASGGQQPAFSSAYLLVKAALLSMVLPVVLVLVGLSTVLGVIPRLRPFVRTVHSVLTGTIGDGYVFVDDSTRYGAVVTRVRDDLDWLIEQCGGNVVVLAHSQGAAVALEAMTRTALAGRVDLVTYGSGIRKLQRLRELRGVVKPPPTWRLLSFVTLSSLTTACAATALITVVQAFGITQLFASVGIFFAVCFLFLVVLWWIGKRSGRTHSQVPGQVTIFGVLVVIVILTPLGVLAQQAASAHDWLRVWQPATGFLWAVSGAGAFLVAWRGNPSQALTIPSTWATAEGHLPRWLDIRASADPVSASPTMGANATPPPTDVKIHNLRSTAFDHTSYWTNWSEFIPLVLNFLSARLPDAPRDQFTVPNYWLERERSRRDELTYFLVSLRGALVALFLCALILSLTKLDLIGQQALNACAVLLPDVSQNAMSRAQDNAVATTVAGVAAIGIGFAAAYWLLARLWHAWVAATSRSQIGLLAKVATTAVPPTEVVAAVAASYHRTRGVLVFSAGHLHFHPVSPRDASPSPATAAASCWESRSLGEIKFRPRVRSRLVLKTHGACFTTLDLRGMAHLHGKIRAAATEID